MPVIKLDKDDIREIKSLIDNTALIDREIASIYGVSRKHINAIRNRKRWNYEYGEKTENSQVKDTSGHIQG